MRLASFNILAPSYHRIDKCNDRLRESHHPNLYRQRLRVRFPTRPSVFLKPDRCTPLVSSLPEI